MKNDNRKKCRKNIELFNGETWRGAWRGAESLQARFVEEYRRFFEKHHIFKATGGAIMGGAHEGALKWRGDFSYTWRGDGGAPSAPVKLFLAQKT